MQAARCPWRHGRRGIATLNRQSVRVPRLSPQSLSLQQWQSPQRTPAATEHGVPFLCRGWQPNRRDVAVILLQDHEGLGLKGEEVEVRPGYHRNLLYPRGIAVYATPENRIKFGREREVVEEVVDEDAMSGSFEQQAFVREITANIAKVEFTFPPTDQPRIITRSEVMQLLWKLEGCVTLGRHQLDCATLWPADAPAWAWKEDTTDYKPATVGEHEITVDLKGGLSKMALGFDFGIVPGELKPRFKVVHHTFTHARKR